MARKRDIRPTFFSNEYLAALPFEARLLFIGLWTIADRRGRLEDRPLRIKATLFPFDNMDMDALLQMLADNEDGFIIRYSVNGKRYIQITNFEKNQHIHRDEAESIIPAPLEGGASTTLPPSRRDPESGVRVVETPLYPPSGDTPNTPSSLIASSLIASSQESVACLEAKASCPADRTERGSAPADNEQTCPTTTTTETPTTALEVQEDTRSVRARVVTEIVAFFNQVCGANYRTSGNKTRERILARLNEGFTLDDFKTVILKKHADWHNDPDMAKYLRPETLFGTKFEGYLNQPAPVRPPTAQDVLADLYHEARGCEERDPE